MVQGKFGIYLKKDKFITSYKKFNSNLFIRAKITKSLEENMGVNLCDVQLHQDFIIITLGVCDKLAFMMIHCFH